MEGEGMGKKEKKRENNQNNLSKWQIGKQGS